ncbi:MAG TPA: hypothetical protein VMV69_27845 [Pirellulales bacterium]|nr:hypothetical protein [Pirellulales bacterium]
MATMNTLYYGDNLDILGRYIADESVDLVYLDPPFNSDQNYNVLFAEQDGTRSASQIQAFGDTWRWDQAAASAYTEIVEGGGQVSLVMQAFRQAIGDNDMLAYLYYGKTNDVIWNTPRAPYSDILWLRNGRCRRPATRPAMDRHRHHLSGRSAHQEPPCDGVRGAARV